MTLKLAFQLLKYQSECMTSSTKNLSSLNISLGLKLSINKVLRVYEKSNSRATNYFGNC